MRWLFLAAAIATELAGTMALRASGGLRRKRWAPAIVCAYLLAFVCLSLSLQHGMPVGVAYGIWSAIGVAATALIARGLFGDALTGRMTAGIGLIAAGVLLIELGSR